MMSYLNPSCPKCGTSQMSGPSYRKALHGEESLVYRCPTCGYEEERPTADQKARVDFGGGPHRLKTTGGPW